MQGIGIGQNLCKAIAQMHGGDVRAQQRSDGQQGAVFVVTLPKSTLEGAKVQTNYNCYKVYF